MFLLCVCVCVLKEIHTFIQEGCFNLIISDSEYMYNVTKDFYFKSNVFTVFFYQINALGDHKRFLKCNKISCQP